MSGAADGYISPTAEHVSTGKTIFSLQSLRHLQVVVNDSPDLTRSWPARAHHRRRGRSAEPQLEVNLGWYQRMLSDGVTRGILRRRVAIFELVPEGSDAPALPQLSCARSDFDME